MNRLEGNIEDLMTEGSLTIVTLKVDENNSLKIIVIETPKTASYLTMGRSVNALFKETEVIIGIDLNIALSISNKIYGSIAKIDPGVLLSRVLIQTSAGNIVSIISTLAVARLKLKETMQVVVMIDMNNIILSP